MELLSFMVISSFEYFAMITLMFAIFRFRFKGLISQTIFICVLLSFISYTVRNEGFVQYASLIQVLLFIVCISLLFRVHWFYSIVMGVAGYQAYGTIQLTLFYLLSYFDIVELEEIVNYNTLHGIIVITVSILIIFLICYFLHRRGWGFTFVPINNNIHVKFTGFNLSIIILAIIGLINIGAVAYFFNTYAITAFIVFTFVQLILLMGSIYYSLKREAQDDY
jgi:hypothetical protein